MDFEKVVPNELWRCISCKSINEVVSVENDEVTYLDRGTKNTHTAHIKVFSLVHERLDADEVLVETGGIF